MAATLALHDDVHLHISGNGIPRLECDELLPERHPMFNLITAVAQSIHPRRRLLIKRPWLHVKQPMYLRAFLETTGTQVVISHREKESLRRSWETTGSDYVLPPDRRIFEHAYQAHLEASEGLVKAGFALMTEVSFLPAEKVPAELDRICRWLNLPSSLTALRTRR
jgi:hypothetical protein